jgi:hypothetical protein
MRGSTHIFGSAVAAGLLFAALVSVSASLTGTGPAAQAQSSSSLGIDVDPSGNTATVLGTRQVCIEVDTGDTFDVDITVENVEELSAWEAYMAFDNTVVSVVDRDVQLFLTSSPAANAFDISDSVPHDEDRPYRVGAANIADPPEGVTGSGVLARLTLEAVGSGSTDLSLGLQQTDIQQPVGPTLTDVNGSVIADSDGDSFFDSPILDAKVVVDETCDGSGATGPSTVLGGDSEGLAWWIFLAAAVGLVATAGIGGAALITLRRGGSRGA